MESIFLRVLNMSLTASVVILAIIIIRLALKKAPKKYSYALWSAAAFRLVCPVSFRSVFSIFSIKALAPTHTETAAAMDYIPSNIGLMARPEVNNFLAAPVNSSLPAAAPQTSANPMQIIIFIACIMWCAGMAGLLIYSLVSYIRLRRRMSNAVLSEGRVYESDRLRSPFIMGFLHPKIYIPFGLSEGERAYVIAHENYHLRRFDHIIKPFAFLILTVHWFNPLVWLAFSLMGRDMEMSCDERVLETTGADSCFYSTTLLSFAAGRRFPAPGPLAFGESGVRSRIKNALRWKKPAVWITALSLVVCAAAVIGCAANPKETEAEPVQEPAQPAAEAPVIANDIGIGVRAGFIYSESVAEMAREYIARQIDYHNELGQTFGYEITAAEITNLEHINTDTAVEGFTADMYRLEYSITPSEPDNVPLDSGIHMEDGLITENGTYLIVACTESSYELICIMGTDEILENYGTPEMLEYYGNAFNAAARELYAQYHAEKTRASAGQRLYVNIRNMEDDQTPFHSMIMDAIYDHYEGKFAESDFACANYVQLTVSSTEDENGQTWETYSLMVMYTQFELENDRLAVTGCSHELAKLYFTVEGTFDDREYTLVDYYEPGGGSDYESGVQENFPYLDSTLRDSQFYTWYYVMPQMRACYYQALEHFGLDGCAIAEQLIGELAASGGSAEKCLENRADLLQELEYYGNFTLLEICNEFLAGGQTGLRGEVMRFVLDDMIGPEALDGNYANGQRYFDAWLEKARELEEELGRSRMYEDYPYMCAVLEMLDQGGAV